MFHEKGVEFDVNMRNSVSPVTEEAGEPVKIRICGTLQDCLVHVSISHESALEERPLHGCFDRCDGYPVTYEFFTPEPADFSFGCLAVIAECLFSKA